MANNITEIKCNECGKLVGYTQGKDTSAFKSCPQKKSLRDRGCKFKN